MNKKEVDKEKCYGHWFARSFYGECVDLNCKLQDICRSEAEMRERLKMDADRVVPDRRFCRSGDCD